MAVASLAGCGDSSSDTTEKSAAESTSEAESTEPTSETGDGPSCQGALERRDACNWNIRDVCAIFVL